MTLRQRPLFSRAGIEQNKRTYQVTISDSSGRSVIGNLKNEFNVILKAVSKQNLAPTDKKKLLTNYFTGIYGLVDKNKFSDFINTITIE